MSSIVQPPELLKARCHKVLWTHLVSWLTMMQSTKSQTGLVIVLHLAEDLLPGNIITFSFRVWQKREVVCKSKFHAQEQNKSIYQFWQSSLVFPQWWKTSFTSCLNPQGQSRLKFQLSVLNCMQGFFVCVCMYMSVRLGKESNHDKGLVVDSKIFLKIKI